MSNDITFPVAANDIQFSITSGTVSFDVTPQAINFEISGAVLTGAGPAGPTGPAGPAGASGSSYYTTSSTSQQVLLGGTYNFTVAAGLAYIAGDTCRIADAVAPTLNYFICTVNSYSGTTLNVTVTYSSWGGGTRASWLINLAGLVGIQGPAGADGATGPAGPNTVTTSTTTNITGIITGNGSVVGSITDNSTAWNAAVPSTRTITTTAPLTIAGTTSADLSANRTIAMPAAASGVSGYLTSTDWGTFNTAAGKAHDAVTISPASSPLSLSIQTLTLNYNTTNLKIDTSTHYLNTIQDITTSSTPQFAKLGLGGSVATGPGAATLLYIAGTYSTTTTTSAFNILPITTGPDSFSAIGGYTQFSGTTFSDGAVICGLNFGNFARGTTAGDINNLLLRGMYVYGTSGNATTILAKSITGLRVQAIDAANASDIGGNGQPAHNQKIPALYGIRIANIPYLDSNVDGGAVAHSMLYVERPGFSGSVDPDYNYQVVLAMSGANTGIWFNGLNTGVAAQIVNYSRIYSNGSGNLRLVSANAAAAESVRVEINQTGIGFFATAPAAKQTVSGSRGGNAALASLLTALSNYGVVTDSSS